MIATSNQSKAKEPAVRLVRMSTDDQEQSPDIQRTAIAQRYESSFNVVDEYIDEGKSGSHDARKRTDFQRLLRDAENPHRGWSVVLAYNSSRFTREDSIDSAAYKKILRDNGIRLITVADGEIDWTTDVGRMMDVIRTEQANRAVIDSSKASLLIPT